MDYFVAMLAIFCDYMTLLLNSSHVCIVPRAHSIPCNVVVKLLCLAYVVSLEELLVCLIGLQVLIKVVYLD